MGSDRLSFSPLDFPQAGARSLSGTAPRLDTSMPSEEEHLPISGAEITAGARLIGAARRLLRRPDPVAVLKRRAEVKDEIRRNLYAKDANWGDPPEVIVVKLGKHDDYPNTDTRVFARGASDWFKAEIKGLHDRGVEVYSAIEYVVIENGKARRVRSDNDPGARKVWVVGRLPYERIAYIDWEPDPGYHAPRFYVAYTVLRREAYREVVLYQGGFAADEYMYEIHDAKYVGEAGGPIKRLGRVVERVRFNVEDRRQDKKRRRGDID